MKTLEERRAILENEINRQQKKGWQIVSRTDTSCQMLINKRPQPCLIILLLLLFIIPAIIYLIVSKKTTTVYLEVNEQGEITYSSKDFSPHEIIEASKQANAEASKFIFKVPPTVQTTNDLGLLTTSVIANGLNISEEEVIKLIEENKLKGKKIGDKYFVRKEDFESFMK
jgi:excisionase family DNA binding protein